MAFRTNKMPVLQEKSASGAVATFNTALAMPLPSCNIAVNAWQEGSGDPSPSNVRPIHGFSEVNVTANNVVHTIQLGQEVYGAEVDVVNGVGHCTHSILTLDGSEDWQPYQIQGRYYANDIIERRSNLVSTSGYLCDSYIFRGNGDTASSGVSVDKSVYMQATYGRVWIYDTDFETDEDLISYLSTHNVAVVYPLAEPFDIQLTPTQIETLIGNNTIFADTGDIDLTYKDLDIAKRGNFREVFKLPS